MSTPEPLARSILQIIVAALGILFLVRFALPGAFGAAGAPFGDPWFVDPGEASPLLDGDIRGFAGIFAGIGVLLLWSLRDLQRYLPVYAFVLAGGQIAGLLRLYSALTLGPPGWPGLAPLVGELILPAVGLWCVHRLARGSAQRG